MIDPDAMPVRSRLISSEELEHAEDKYLDFEYEESLRSENDDLMPIPDGECILTEFFGSAGKAETDDLRKAGLTESPKNNKAMEIAVRLSEEQDEVEEMPELPENPSEQDLLDFAAKHPAVRAVAKLFRGKVVAVKKKS